MIEIRIPEVHYSEDQNQDPIKRSKMEIFTEGFKKLCDAIGMYKIKINTNSILDLKNSQLNFDDNSMVDIKRLFNEIGFNV